MPAPGARGKLQIACFAAALAKHRNAELITGDPEFKAVEKEISIRWLAEQANEGTKKAR